MRTVGNKVPFCVVCQDAIKKVVLSDTAKGLMENPQMRQAYLGEV